MSKIVNLLALTTVLALVAGCATSNRTEHEMFTIKSTPTGSTATLSTGESCVTPCSLERPRGEQFRVTVAKTGFKPVTTTIQSIKSSVGGRPATASVGVGGIFNVPIGAQSGSSYDLKPNPLVVSLEPRKATK